MSSLAVQLATSYRKQKYWDCLSDLSLNKNYLWHDAQSLNVQSFPRLSRNEQAQSQIDLKRFKMILVIMIHNDNW